MNDQILKIIEAAEKSGLTRFGIRFHHETVKVGDDLGVSYNTLDDQPEKRITGICCLQISYDGFEVEDFDYDLDQIKEYAYKNGCIILVGGTGGDYGNDQNETIIENAKVLWVAE